MTGKFQIRDLMIKVASEDDMACPTGSGQSTCGGQSCTGGGGGGDGGGGGEDCQKDQSFKPATNCGRPTCKQPPPRRKAGVDDLVPGNLALLQKELRRALDLRP